MSLNPTNNEISDLQRLERFVAPASAEPQKSKSPCGSACARADWPRLDIDLVGMGRFDCFGKS